MRLGSLKEGRVRKLLDAIGWWWCWYIGWRERAVEWKSEKGLATLQQLRDYGEKKKKKKVHSTGLRYTPGLFSLSAKYIKKEKNPNELGFSSAPASSRPTRWLYRVWWDRFFKQAHHYIYSLSLSGYKLKEIPSIMLYYVGTGGSRRKKRDQEKRRRRVGDHQTSVFLLKREKIRVNGCSGFLSLYDEFAIKISRTSRNFHSLFSLSLVSLSISCNWTEQTSYYAVYLPDTLVCDVLQYSSVSHTLDGSIQSALLSQSNEISLYNFKDWAQQIFSRLLFTVMHLHLVSYVCTGVIHLL